jgi:Fe2+ transport system protein FeoA
MLKANHTLATLGKGKPARITAVHTDDASLRKLLALGVIEGCEIELLHEGFLGRDPLAIRVDDRIIALRRAQAAAIDVEPIVA